MASTRPAAASALRNLAGATREQLGEVAGGPSYRAAQMWEACMRPEVCGGNASTAAWSLQRPLGSITTLPAALRQDMDASGYHASWGTVRTLQRSALDGTVKLLVGLAPEQRDAPDDGLVEAVVIPAHSPDAGAGPDGGAAGTVCVSSQVGCSFSCRFCRTGTQRRERNLTGAQIAGQVLLADAAVRREHACDAELSEAERAVPVPSRIRSVVFMGQGEPLMNWPAVSQAIDILSDDRGPAPLSRRRFTVSTVGVASRIPLVADAGARLALSLHSAVDSTRTAIMPTNARFPLAEVQRSLVEYLARAGASRALAGGQRDARQPGNRHAHWARVSLEVTLLRGVNDDLDGDVDSICRFAKGLGEGAAHVNLIPFNAWPGSTLRPSSKGRLLRFAERLRRKGVHTTIRATRGRDILAACGQLHSEVEASLRQ